MGHGEVGLPAEPVPADVGVTAQLLLQADPEGLCIRGPVQTTLLQGSGTSFSRLLLQVWGINPVKQRELATSLRSEKTPTGPPSMRSRQLWLSWYFTKDHSNPSDTYSSWDRQTVTCRYELPKP